MIEGARARMILDSRGFPTIRVELQSRGRWFGANAPSGASTGKREALEKRDGGVDWGGKGVENALAGLRDSLFPEILGRDPRDQKAWDALLLAKDGTAQKEVLGANAILPVSLAGARVGAHLQGVPLWQWIATLSDSQPSLPVPTLNVLNGGVHADNGLDVQEFMVVPHLETFSLSLKAGVEVYHALHTLLGERGHSVALGDEGGFAPRLNKNIDALSLVAESVERAGYRLKEEISLALDVASSELANPEGYRWEGGDLSADALVEIYEGWADRFPLISIEDGMGEDDRVGWGLLTARLGSRMRLVGDDLLVTQNEEVKKAIEGELCNALLVKVNQVGTLTQTLEAVEEARQGGWAWSVSHRSGETCDDFIADLAVGSGAPFIKTGAPARGERTSKYNRLLAVEEEGVKFNPLGLGG